MSTTATSTAPTLADLLPAFDPATQVPPPPELPTAVLSTHGTARARLTLHGAIAARLDLKRGQRINLLPPAPGSSFWLLDLRPDVAPKCLSWSANCPRIEGLQLPPGTLTVGQPLTLYLLPGEPYYPNVYPLLDARALTHALAA
jgi:hypothetical protein